jgi:hypothetical protein
MVGHPRETFEELAATHEHAAIVDVSEVDRPMSEPGPTTAPRFKNYSEWLDHWGGIAAGVGVLFK